MFKNEKLAFAEYCTASAHIANKPSSQRDRERKLRNRLWGQDERTKTQANILCITSDIVAAVRYLQMPHQSAAQCPKHTHSKQQTHSCPLSFYQTQAHTLRHTQHTQGTYEGSSRFTHVQHGVPFLKNSKRWWCLLSFSTYVQRHAANHA